MEFNLEHFIYLNSLNRKYNITSTVDQHANPNCNSPTINNHESINKLIIKTLHNNAVLFNCKETMTANRELYEILKWLDNSNVTWYFMKKNILQTRPIGYNYYEPDYEPGMLESEMKEYKVANIIVFINDQDIINLLKIIFPNNFVQVYSIENSNV